MKLSKFELLRQQYEEMDSDFCHLEYEKELEEAAALGLDWMSYTTKKMQQELVSQMRSRSNI